MHSVRPWPILPLKGRKRIFTAKKYNYGFTGLALVEYLANQLELLKIEPSVIWHKNMSLNFRIGKNVNHRRS